MHNNEFEDLLITEATTENFQEIAQVSATCWRQTYKNIIDQEFLDNISVERRKLGRANWFSKPNKFSIIALY